MTVRMGRLRGVLLGVAVLGAIAGTTATPAHAASQTATVSTSVRNASGSTVTSVTAGTTVHPYVSVSGFGGTPTGTVTITTFSNGTCGGTIPDSYGASLSGGALDATGAAYETPEPTTISFKAIYSGDATYFNNAGPCTPVTFTKVDPAVALQFKDAVFALINGPIGFGVPIHPLVTIFGSADYATGIVDVQRWSLPGCSGSSAVQWGLSLTNGKAEASSNLQWTPPTPGSYSFSAHYHGDSTYNAKSSSCVTLVVSKIAPTMYSKLMANGQDAPAAVGLGSDVYPNVQLEGSQGLGIPTGTVTRNLYKGSTCGGAVYDAESMPAAEFLNPAGTPWSFGTPTITSWQVVYNGSSSYTALTGPCLHVSWKAPSLLGLAVENASNAVVGQVTAGTAIHPRMTASGDYGTPTGKVTVSWFASGTCAGGTVLGTRTLSGGVVDDPALDVVPAAAGQVSFKATYTGDAAYLAQTSSCVPVTVSAAPGPVPTPTPTATPAGTPGGVPGPSATPAAPGATDGAVVSEPAASIPASSDPAASEAAAASNPVIGGGAGEAARPTDGAAFAGAPGSVTPSASAGGIPAWLLVLVAAIAIVAGLGVVLGRRRRSVAQA